MSVLGDGLIKEVHHPKEKKGKKKRKSIPCEPRSPICWTFKLKNCKGGQMEAPFCFYFGVGVPNVSKNFCDEPIKVAPSTNPKLKNLN